MMKCSKMQHKYNVQSRNKKSNIGTATSVGKKQPKKKLQTVPTEQMKGTGDVNADDADVKSTRRYNYMQN